MVCRLIFYPRSITDAGTSDDIMFDHKWMEDDFIGMDHPAPSKREKGVFIR
jgi:hypothetical protein